MRNLRKLAVLASVVTVTVLLTGCRVRLGFVGAEKKGAMTGRYFYYNGSKTQSVSLKAGDELDFAYDVKVASGQVVLTITDPEGDIVRELVLDDDAKESFVIQAEHDGSYAVKLDLRGTRGAYAMSWAKK